MNRLQLVCALGVIALCTSDALCSFGESDENVQAAPSSSLMARNNSTPAVSVSGGASGVDSSHALRQASMFAVAPPEPRTFQKHDLIQIIVREQSQARSTQELDTEKEYNIDGRILAFPNLQLSDLLQFQMYAGRTTNLPEIRTDFKKEFSGDGDYRRRDDLTARITAEVIEVLPNGNMVLEARTHIKTDREEQIIKVTGVCQPKDITAANTVLSNQIHNLKIEKMHEGELPRATEKGIISQVLDFIFAF